MVFLTIPMGFSNDGGFSPNFTGISYCTTLTKQFSSIKSEFLAISTNTFARILKREVVY